MANNYTNEGHGSMNINTPLDKYQKVNKMAYNTLAAEYEKRVQIDLVGDIPIVDRVWNVAQKQKTGNFFTVLDVGCGHGVNLKLFNDKGAETTGVEFAPAMAEVARKVSPKSRIIVDNFLTFENGEQKFNLIFAKAFLHLFPLRDCSLVINKMKHLLDNDGCIYLATTLADTSIESYKVKTDYEGSRYRFRREWAPVDLKQFLSDHGLEILDEWANCESSRNKLWQNLILKKPST